MHVPKRLVLLTIGALAAAAVIAVGASGGDGAKLLRSSLAPSVPTDPTIHGVLPGGVPWQLESGSVQVKAGGGFELELEGLVIPSLGTAGPVTSVSASLFCGNDTTPAATTETVPLSSAGDADLETGVALPGSCLAPVVVVHPNGGKGRYIAVTGFKL